MNTHQTRAEDSHRWDVLWEGREAERWAEDAAGFGRWSIDLINESVVWSRGLANLFGRAELAERAIDLEQHIACYHPDERTPARWAIRKGGGGAATGVGEFTRHSRILRPDGEVRDVVLHGRTMHDAHGTAVGVCGITLDVTPLIRSERGLRASEFLLRNTLENLDQGIIQFGPDGRVRVFNQRAGTLLDLPEPVLCEGAEFEALHGILVTRGDFDSLSASTRAELERRRQARLPHGLEITRADRTLEIRYTPLANGGTICTFLDISARRAAEATVRESERRFRLIAENVNDVIVLGDLSMHRRYVSPNVRSQLGYATEQFLEEWVTDRIHPDDRHVFAEHWSRLCGEHDTCSICCCRLQHAEGHYLWIEFSVRLVRDPDNGRATGYVAALRDVSARKAAEEQVQHMALHDGLTGLPNRILFHDRLDRAIVHAEHSSRAFAVLACDLDRFKAVNDSFGHPAGDVLLRVVAERMQAVLRPYDTVARLGGDEFAILLTDLDEPGAAARLAEDLIAAVGVPVDLDGQTVEVGVSIGLAVASGEIANADELFKRADIALYEAKAAGRSTYRVFCPNTGAKVASRSQLGLDMKEAIRHGDFRLVYQPVVDTATGAVKSFEALMRWRHPQRGEISPGEFIPLAEENGLIVPLGKWALEEACREAMHWPCRIRIGVNVSPVQLRQHGLEATVLSALAVSGLPANRLKLEVTESVLMEDAEEVIARLHRLRALGVRIALDDFGTGYSSLSYLRRFPFDKIKIDRAFIRDIADPDAAAIVRAVVGIGERLGMGIVAEGVETAEQLELVRREGCGEVQGFLFSRPLPAPEARIYAKGPKARVA
ncbi:EAL domain-containing protein [Methylobacterium sp. J-067]|uniref:sensor domain-containing protein n=1 Tax=Methylobacterium sp. J-067 TaxID=2836648 RepID=UPI001FBB6632|nr:EAL domain-containing protein [Methylobacterium sp. J-067]